MTAHTTRRPSRAQEAIALARADAGKHEQLILASILEQRIRLKTRHIENTQRALAQGRIEQRSLLQIAQSAAHSNRLLLTGWDFARQHPVATGFFLGFGLVAAPRKLLRAAIALLPLIHRFSR